MHEMHRSKHQTTAKQHQRSAPEQKAAKSEATTKRHLLTVAERQEKLGQLDQFGQCVAFIWHQGRRGMPPWLPAPEMPRP